MKTVVLLYLRLCVSAATVSRYSVTHTGLADASLFSLSSAHNGALRIALEHVVGGADRRVLIVLPPCAYASFCGGLSAQEPLDATLLSPITLSRIAIKQCRGGAGELVSFAVAISALNRAAVPSLIILISPEVLFGLDVISGGVPDGLRSLNAVIALLCGAPFRPLIHLEFTPTRTTTTTTTRQQWVGLVRALLCRAEWPLTA